MAAKVEPTTVPTPPRMLTPPTTAAVMMVSSRLGGTVDWMTESWVANRSEATPTKTPCSDEHHHHGAPPADAGEPGGLGVAADGVDARPRPQ